MRAEYINSKNSPRTGDGGNRPTSWGYHNSLRLSTEYRRTSSTFLLAVLLSLQVLALFFAYTAPLLPIEESVLPVGFIRTNILLFLVPPALFLLVAFHWVVVRNTANFFAHCVGMAFVILGTLLIFESLIHVSRTESNIHRASVYYHCQVLKEKVACQEQKKAAKRAERSWPRAWTRVNELFSGPGTPSDLSQAYLRLQRQILRKNP